MFHGRGRERDASFDVVLYFLWIVFSTFAWGVGTWPWPLLGNPESKESSKAEIKQLEIALFVKAHIIWLEIEIVKDAILSMPVINGTCERSSHIWPILKWSSCTCIHWRRLWRSYSHCFLFWLLLLHPKSKYCHSQAKNPYAPSRKATWRRVWVRDKVVACISSIMRTIHSAASRNKSSSEISFSSS